MLPNAILVIELAVHLCEWIPLDGISFHGKHHRFFFLEGGADMVFGFYGKGTNWFKISCTTEINLLGN